MRRYALRNDQWDRIKDFLPGREGHVGGTAADNRLFVEAVLYRYRAGIPWRDIGRSRGGLTTKIHVLVDALGNPVEVMLTPGQAHDLTCAQPLLDEADPQALIGDKAYDADPLIDTLTERGIDPVIPPKANRKNQRACDYPLYCERNLIERFFNKLKHFRAIATRYDKLARNFLAGIQLACAIILLN